MDEAVRRIASGESTPEALAVELDVDVKSVKRWVRIASRAAGASTPAAMGSPAEPSATLHKALGAAGISSPEAIPPMPKEQTAAAVEKSGGELPAPTPEQLMLIIEAIDRVTISAIVGVKGKRLPPKKLEELCKLPKSDREMMEALAPYAADYLPTAMAYAKPVMAGLFVAVWGLSVVTRLKQVQAEQAALSPQPVAATVKAA